MKKQPFISIILFLLLLLPKIVFGQFINKTHSIFENITKENGLRNGHILEINQDQKGYIWLSTYGGLHRFDGRTFDYYTHNDSIKESLSSNAVYSTLIDSKNRLWVGSEDGLSLFLPETNNFKNYNGNKFSFGKNSLRKIAEDKNGNLWIATYGAGVALFDPKKEVIIKWYTKENKTIPGNFVNTLMADSKGNIWVGFEGSGLYLYSFANNTFTKKGVGFPDQTINSIKEDKKGNLWIGHWTGGLSYYDRSNESIKSFQHLPNNSNSIPDNTVRQIEIDKNNIIWLATTNGLGMFNPESEKCITFQNDKQYPTSLSFDFLWSVFQDNEGIVWAGTFGNGLCKLDANKNKFDIINNQSKTISNEFSYIDFIYSDTDGTIWAAANNGGISLYQPNQEKLLSKKIATHFPRKKIRSVHKDQNGYYWFGCEDGAIRCKKNFNQPTFISYENNLSGFNILTINEDKNGNIWFGGWNTGLFKLPAEKKYSTTLQFKDLVHYKSAAADFKKIPTDVIWTIYTDSKKDMWVATSRELLRLNYSTNKFETIIKDIINIASFAEFPDGTLWITNSGIGLHKIEKGDIIKKIIFPIEREVVSCYGIVQKNNKLWIGSEDGLFSYEPSTEKFQHFTTLDGLPTNTFLRNSTVLAKDGSILMGTINGLIRFIPDELSTIRQDPNIRISDISIFNKSITLEHSKKPLLKKSLDETKEIILNYKQNDLTISFSSIQFSMPQKIIFLYQLEGFNAEWLVAEKNNPKATYTNLDPGDYTFNVKAIYENGSKGNNLASIKIKIAPPFWETIWFRLILISALISLFFFILYLRTTTIKKRAADLKKEVTERTLELEESNTILSEQNIEMNRQAEKIRDQQKELLDKKYVLEKSNNELAEWNEFQNRLIAILGHDIRGPIQNFSLLLRLKTEESEEWVNERLKATADSLSILASDLMGWVSLQSNKGTLEFTTFTWGEIVERVLLEIEPIREEKNISFSITLDTSITLSGIVPIVRSSLRNILSNAIRFSDQGSMIEIETITSTTGFSGIRITDFGKGFDCNEVNRLIQGEAFLGLKEQSLKDGAGLGMAICYDMLKRIGGSIVADSLPGSGATFYLFLPLENNIPSVFPEEKTAQIENSPFVSSKTGLLKGKKILLVDDDDELRWLVVQSLSKYIEIIEVRNATEALEWLKDNTPDMALLDINMPGISGLELCKKIKNTPALAHVPCMVISGEMGDQIKTTSFEAGADSFIAKPFNPEELCLQIIAYFENYTKNILRFFKEALPIDELTQNKHNKVFLSDLILLIESNLNAEALNVDFLAKALGLSRSSLYRRLKSLTGQTVNDFIKNIRLRKSFTLLKDGQLNISEVAHETGFTSPSYFAASFKKHFGYSPTELKK